MISTWKRVKDLFTPNKAAHLRLGARGERLARQRLRQGGLRILKRNFRTPRGEIDLVARDGNTLVFVEVKTRTNVAWTRPSKAVSSEQKQRIISAGADYYRRIGRPAVPVRFDIVEVIVPDDGPTQVEWLSNAFSTDRSRFHPRSNR